MANTKREELVGVYRSTRWTSKAGDRIIGVLADKTCVLGPADPTTLIPGGTYRFLGVWKDDSDWGKQFHFDVYTESIPHTYHGVIEYLVRNTEHVGIGRIIAHALCDKFGADKVVGILKNTPEAVAAAIPRVSIEMAKLAGKQLRSCEQFEQTKISLLDLIAGRGFPGSLVEWCVKKFGILGPRRIAKDPYVLLTHGGPGCGFQRVDAMYLELGLPPNRLKRQAICAWHAMDSDMTGSVWFQRSLVETRVKEKVSGKLDLSRAIALSIRGRLNSLKVVDGVEWLATRENAEDEESISYDLERLSFSEACWPSVELISESDKISVHQRRELLNATVGPVGILTGLPGTGKSFSLARLVGLLPQGSVALCAPTGRAAVRVTEVMSQYDYPLRASTIHSLLGVDQSAEGWRFLHDEVNTLPYSYFIIDECSMIPASLLASLLRAIPNGAKVLFIGDPNQLPPVGAGRPFLDMIEAGLPRGHLNEVHRYAGRIAQVCKAINDGSPWEPSKILDVQAENEFPENMRHVERANPRHQVETLLTVIDRVVNQRGYDPIWDAQVLCAVNDKSLVSRKSLNTFLQKLLNPDGEQLPNNPFRNGDKVMCLKNGFRVEHWWGEQKPRVAVTHYLANGEIGRVVEISEHWIAVELGGRDLVVRFGRVEWSEIDLAYACTVHKAQGAGFPVVILMIDGSDGAKWVCSRAHHYTAISRASEICVTIGRMGVLHAHCQKVDLEKRVTFLTEGIQEWSTNQLLETS